MQKHKGLMVNELQGYPPESARPENTKRKELSLESNTKAFTISNLLSKEECQFFIGEADRIGFTSLADQYPKHYRRSTRVLVRSQKLAEDLFNRVSQFLTREDITKARPHDFANEGVWKPVGFNDVFKFSYYDTQGAFRPHYDGCLVVSNQIRSVFTLLIYLNDDFQKGETVFFNRSKYSRVREHHAMLKFLRTTVKPKTGKAVMFDQNVLHSGDVVRGNAKYVVKTELLFRRTDWSAIPATIYAYKDDPNYKKAKELFDLSAKHEKKGDVSSATAIYLQAMEIQRNYRAVTTKPEPQTKIPLTIDLFSKIYSYLNLSAILNCATVSRAWREITLDGLIWRQIFVAHFPNLIAIESFTKQTSPDKAFLEDWYQSFKNCYLLKKNKFPALCIDFGSIFTKYGWCGSRMSCAPSYVAVENHNHVQIVGGGIADYFMGGHDYTLGLDLIHIFKPYKCGKQIDYYGLWVLLNSIQSAGSLIDDSEGYNSIDYFSYEERKHLYLHPILLAEDSRTKFDREKLYHLMFTLFRVPAVCIVDSTILAMHAINSNTCIVVDFGKGGVTFTPVWNGSIVEESIKTYPVGSKLLAKHFCKMFSADQNRRYYLKIESEGKYQATVDYCSVRAKDDDSILQQNDAHDFKPLGRECGDILFNTNKLSKSGLQIPDAAKETTSVSDFVYNSIMACEESKRSAYFNCILVCGGIPQMPGFVERFETEIQLKNSKAKVVALPNPQKTILQGAYNYASSSSFHSNCVYRHEYLAKHPEPNVHIPETKVMGSLLQSISSLFKKEK